MSVQALTLVTAPPPEVRAAVWEGGPDYIPLTFQSDVDSTASLVWRSRTCNRLAFTRSLLLSRSREPSAFLTLFFLPYGGSLCDRTRKQLRLCCTYRSRKRRSKATLANKQRPGPAGKAL